MHTNKHIPFEYKFLRYKQGADKTGEGVAKYTPEVSLAPVTKVDFVWGQKDHRYDVLSSSSFNSCVGLVLYHSASQFGIVMHFQGSMTGVNAGVAIDEMFARIIYRINNREDKEEKSEKKITKTGWKATVFGGSNLNSNDIAKTTIRSQSMTRKLMDNISTKLGQKDFDITITKKEEGYLSVRLRLDDGNILLLK